MPLIVLLLLMALFVCEFIGRDHVPVEEVLTGRDRQNLPLEEQLKILLDRLDAAHISKPGRLLVQSVVTIQSSVNL